MRHVRKKFLQEKTVTFYLLLLLITARVSMEQISMQLLIKNC